ncbi:hypothetical protein A4X09_0g7291 [Tilletia walkeri]|uniref:Anaphase-promoting complex subunit 5 domain-containing protein n=1 Tax=Tilletia walkeri TaxID=117179 RepID=A0A8X7N3I4_9BASI|nr:hypothetical protein A4X09_0g7291 [Tilletia walkeri]
MKFFKASASTSSSNPPPTNVSLISHLKVGGAGQISWNDDIAATDTVKTLFNQLAGLASVAGPYLQTSLGLVQEIFAIVQDLKDKDNWDAYIELARKAMLALQDLAVSEKERGRLIFPGTDAAVLAEGINKGLKNLQDQLQEYAQLSQPKRYLKHSDHKKSVIKLATEINSVISHFNLKGDLEKLSQMALSAENVREKLQQVSPSIRAEVKRRSTIDESQVDHRPASSHQQYSITADEASALSELQRLMKRMYFRGEGEDLAGVFDEDSNEPPNSEQDSIDDAQTALKLLDELCKVDDSFDNKKALGQIRDLSYFLDRLGLYEESLSVVRLFAALCRRKANDQEASALDLSNQAFALMCLSGSLHRVGHFKEALASSEEATAMFQKMAYREPKRYNPSLVLSQRLLVVSMIEFGRLDEAVRLCRQSLDILRTIRRNKPKTLTEEFAGTLLNYSNLLSETGQHNEALEAIEESVKLWRSLHAARPAAFQSVLGMALNNYSIQLSDAGRRGEALRAIEETLELYRSLHAARPAAFETELARTLANYSSRLRDVGRHKEAREAIEQSLELWRSLHASRPGAFEADLAGALHGYSVQLSNAGKYNEALVATEESLRLCRSLHAARPAAFEGELARTLQVYSIQLSEAGKHTEALEANEESLALYGSLYATRPAVFEADLAGILHNYSKQLREAGRREEALKAIEKSLKLHRSPYAARSAGREEGLAKTLDEYSVQLREAGRHKESVQMTEESVGLYRSVNTARPQPALKADLAMALGTYSNRLSEVGRHQDALEAVEESLSLFRSLHTARPAAFEGHLALSLNGYSLRLVAVEKHSEAVQAIEEALRIFDSFADPGSAWFQGAHSAALDSYSTCLSHVKRPQEALSAIEQAIVIVRPLYDTDPNAYQEAFAEVLHNHSQRLNDCNRPADALEAVKEALQIYQHDGLKLKGHADALDSYAKYLTATGQDEEAAEVRQTAAVIRSDQALE